jgi:hypothetical protein
MKKITLLLYLAILTANCSKKSEDNSFKNLFLLGYLSNTKAEAASLSEIVSLTAGVSIRQKLDVIEGQGINYTVSQTSSASSSMHSRDSLFDNRIVISLVDSDNKELYSTITIPGSSETLRYIPKKSGQFTAVITPFGNGTISTSIEGGSKANTLSSQNSVISAISGKRKYRITGAILQGAWVLINVDEVTSISADGRATFSPITDAIVTLTVDSTTDFSTTYNNNLKRIAVKLKWTVNLTSHAARHTFATLALSTGIDVYLVSKLLGHQSVKQTEVYLKIVNQQLDGAMDRLN